MNYMEQFSDFCKSFILDKNLNVEILGPAPCGVERKKHHFTWYYTIRSSSLADLHTLISFIQINFKFKSTHSMKIDVDPDQAF